MSIADLNPPISPKEWTDNNFTETFNHFTPVEKIAIHTMMNAYVQECLWIEGVGTADQLDKEMD